MHVKS